MASVVSPSRIADLTSRFDSLVQEFLPEVARVETQLVDDFVGPGAAPFVIYGFGDIGRRLLAGFATLGVVPLAIIDRRLAQAQDTIEGIPCLSVEEGCKVFAKKAAFIVAVFNQSGERAVAAVRKELQRLGAQRVVYFMPVFWKYSEVFLPHYCFDSPSKLLKSRPELLQVSQNLADDDSRICFAFHLYQLIAPSPEMTLEATLPDETYFPPDVLQLSSHEAFVDGGAFDGVTLRRFLSRCRERFARYLGIEPDPANFAKLEAFVERVRPTVPGHLEIRQCAVGREHAQIDFAAGGTISSAANASGDISVPVIPLAELAKDFRPTLIKLDVEGFELAALEGSTKFLQQMRPKLAICLYHRQSHFWEIPLFVLRNLPDYRLYVRRHKEHLDDFVLYALPQNASRQL
jgi:FkbM family methyltransferase